MVKHHNHVFHMPWHIFSFFLKQMNVSDYLK